MSRFARIVEDPEYAYLNEDEERYEYFEEDGYNEDTGVPPFPHFEDEIFNDNF